MKAVQKERDEQFVILEVTASEEDVSRAFEIAEINFCQAMGVRMDPNKTLAQSAQEQMGVGNLDMLVNQQAVDALVPLAIDKHDFYPAYMPKVDNAELVMRGKPYTFQVKVPLKPQFELASYDPVEIRLYPYDGDDETVDAQLAELAKNAAEFVDIDEDRAVVDGDAVNVSLICKQDGREIKPLTTDGRSYVVGSGGMPVAFDAGVIGMKKGETKTFEFQATSYDGSTNEMLSYEATVGLNSIQKEVVPELTDEWVARNMKQFSSLSELRGKLAEQVHGLRYAQYQDYVRNVASIELSKRFMGHIPDDIFSNTRETVQNELRQQVSSQGMRWDDFVAKNGGDEKVERNIFMQTRQSLVQCYALDAVYRHEGLKATEQDMKDVCQQINPQMPEEARHMMEEQGYNFSLRESAERLCASKWIAEHALITYIDAESELDVDVDED